MSNFKIFLSSPPEYAVDAAAFKAVSIMAYRVGRGFHLYRTVLPEVRCAVMDVNFTGFTGFGPHNVLISEILRECAYRGYSGISVGISSRPTQQAAEFFSHLSDECENRGITLYLPENLVSVSASTKIIIPAQNVFGTYNERLKKLCDIYGGERIALELERIYTDYPLPSKSGFGSVISKGRFEEISSSCEEFYSEELCANYLS